MRCYFIKNGHIVAVEMLFGLSDQEAIEKSHELFAAQSADYEGFEVWDTTRVVVQWMKSEDDPTPDSITSPPPPAGPRGGASQAS
jgi:hypothetical protein